MPARHTRQQDPMQRIHRWDDGYEYIRDKTPTPPEGRDPAPFFSPPPSFGRPYTYEPDPPRNHRDSRRNNGREDPYLKRAYPSPPSDSDGDHARQRRHHSPPPPYRSTRSPSPPPRPRQRRPSLESRSTAPLPRSKPTRYRSPSPTARHRHGRDRRRSPSPLLPGGRMHNRDHHGGDYHRYHHNTNPKRRHHSRSPSPPPKSKSTGRPAISRSKTTTTAAAAARSSAAAAAKEAKERFPGLSPRWQQAAMAAFQAGSMAALNMRSQPGAWNGEKGARVASAALGAAAMDAFSKKEKENESSGSRKGGGASSGGGSGSRKSAGGGKRSNSGVEAIGGALGGFLADQFAKQRESKKGGRR